MDSMHTDSLTSALHSVMVEHGWRSQDLAFYAGSSLVLAIEKTVDELRQLTEEEEEGFQDEQEWTLPQLQRWSRT